VSVPRATSRRRSPGWLFVAPALALIAAFFFVPVVASVLLSFTDFDIYSVASLDNLRIVGAANYRHLFDDVTASFFAVIADPEDARRERIGHSLPGANRSPPSSEQRLMWSVLVA